MRKKTSDRKQVGTEAPMHTSLVSLLSLLSLVSVVACAHTPDPPPHARAAPKEVFAAIKAKDSIALAAVLDRDPQLASSRNEKGRSAVLAALFTMKTSETFLPPQENACLRLLLAKKPALDPFETAAVGDAADLEQEVKRTPSLPTSVHELGWTPLHFAAYGGNVATAEVLLAHGAAIDAAAKNHFRNTPLQASLLSGQGATMRLLLARGANVNAKQEGGFTPLHEAAQGGEPALLQALVDAGADVNAAADEGATPLDAAIHGKHEAAVSWLRARGARPGTGKLE